MNLNFQNNVQRAVNFIKENKKPVIFLYIYFLILALFNTVITWSLVPGDTITTLFAFLMELVQMIGAVYLLREVFFTKEDSVMRKIWQAICDTPLFLFYNIVVGLHLLFGLILLVIPGFYFLSKVYFAPYLSIVGDQFAEHDKSYVEWSKELTKNNIAVVLFYIIVFNFLPMLLFAPLAWVKLGSIEKLVQLGICPLETALIIFGEVVFIHFFKDILDKTKS
jgi:hypothetical protein